jgi:hypothetical protein
VWWVKCGYLCEALSVVHQALIEAGLHVLDQCTGIDTTQAPGVPQ